jgi:hypothetical protein
MVARSSSCEDKHTHLLRELNYTDSHTHAQAQGFRRTISQVSGAVVGAADAWLRPRCWRGSAWVQIGQRRIRSSCSGSCGSHWGQVGGKIYGKRGWEAFSVHGINEKAGSSANRQASERLACILALNENQSLHS